MPLNATMLHVDKHNDPMPSLFGAGPEEAPAELAAALAPPAAAGHFDELRGGVAPAEPSAATDTTDLSTSVVLASRSEVTRGDWEPFERRCHVRPTGSVAYKMALVATGEADATISLAPKHGWDVCAGILLVEEAGGRASLLDGGPLDMAHPAALIDGLIASNVQLHAQIVAAVTATRRPA